MGFFSFKPLKIITLVLAILAVESFMVMGVPTTSAFHNPENSGDCGQYLKVTTTENPSCDASTNDSLTKDYSATYTITSLDKPLDLQVNTETWYCTDANPHDGSDPSRSACRKSPQTNEFTASVPAGGTKSLTLARNLDQESCGSVQTDLSFDVFVNGQKVCSYGNPNFVYGFSFCSTGRTCDQPSPTPTPIPSPTPTCACVSTPTPTQIPTSIPTTTPAPITQPTPTSGPNVIINVSQQQQQQQQQQLVLAATVAPVPQTFQLPSTGSGIDILFALSSLIPLGWKIRKIL